MKKKFYLFALVAAALVSCNNDEFQTANDNFKMADDGSQLFVTVDENDGSVSTRAGFAIRDNGGEYQGMYIWNQGDKLKVYCTNTWKPQIYELKQDAVLQGVNGARGQVFDFAYVASDEATEDVKKKADYNVEEVQREYAVYPAEPIQNVKLYFTATLYTHLGSWQIL